MYWDERAWDDLPNQEKKRHRSVLDRTAALYIIEIQIREGTHEVDQPVILADWRKEYNLRNNAVLRSKGVGI